MALYWPDKKVALDIVDDPGRPPLTLFDDDWTIVRATCAELENPHSFRQVMRQLAKLVGSARPQCEGPHPSPQSPEKLSA